MMPVLQWQSVAELKHFQGIKRAPSVIEQRVMFTFYDFAWGVYAPQLIPFPLAPWHGEAHVIRHLCTCIR